MLLRAERGHDPAAIRSPRKDRTVLAQHEHISELRAHPRQKPERLGEKPLGVRSAWNEGREMGHGLSPESMTHA
jgi:hypothetical protein